MGQVVRGVLAILGGLVTVLAIDGLCYFISMHVFSRSFDHVTIPFLLVNLMYSFFSRTVGGFVAGDIGHRRPMLYGVLLALILYVLGAFNLVKGVGVFSRGTVYVLTLNLVGPLFAIYGAYLWGRRRRPSVQGI